MMGSRPRLTGLLLLLMGVILAVIGLQLDNRAPDQPSGLPARVGAPDSEAAVARPEAPNRANAWFKEVLARPLFNPDRRPVVSGAQSLRGLPRLTGTIVTDSRQVALFAAPSGGHPTVVEAGAHVGPYEVRAISDTGVTIVGPGGTMVLRPVFDPAPPPVSKPGPPLARPEPVRAK
jgi:hypothetical protein